MKKIGIIAVGILVITIVGIFFFNVQENDYQLTDNQAKIGMILNGACDDKSYSQSHYESMEMTAVELNLEVVYKENVPLDERCKDVMNSLIEEGCSIIICNSFNYGVFVEEMAKEHPEIYFFHATGTGEGDNLTSFFGRMYQMRYLSGIVAGMQTKTNEIGYVASFPIAEVNRGINAFTLGVRAVNPEAVVYVKWTDSWTDNTTCSETTEALISEHNIDVLAMHVDSIKPLQIADEAGVYCIGYNRDNSKDYPNTYLTAAVWQWDAFYKSKITECLQGKFEGGHYWLGIDSGMIGMAPYTDNIEAGVAERVEAEIERLESGTFDVFYGPITDQNGEVRVTEGESMSDEALLNEFDWYVEGVVIDEE